MLLGPIFERFVKDSPVSVMVQGIAEHALDPGQMDALFDRCADRQYTRTLLFSSVVDLMALVVTGVRKSLHAAYQATANDIAVSLTSVYNKLNGIEPDVSAELVRHTACRLTPVQQQLGGTLPDWVPGYRTRILDGNHLAATDHRLAETRTNAAAPLPGQALVVFEPALGLVTDVFCCEDGHAQERSLLDEVVARLRERDLWLADRNFCVRAFLLALVAGQAFFIIRQHEKLAWEPAGKVYGRGRIDGARVREQRVAIRQDDGRRVFLRRVVLELDKPTRDGDTQLALLTNLPAEAADACKVGRLYRKRWTIEEAFAELEKALASELNTLCYPKAALFVFSVALAAYNMLGLVKGALRACHGPEQAGEVSGYYLADEVAGTYRGMLIAIPDEHWRVFGGLTAAELAEVLRALAGNVRLAAFRRHPRGPKKPSVKRRYSKKHPHVSTARLLENRRSRKKV
ncbi:MAG TPA: transposase [Gemmataceae bacterium]|jgi:IS4 transposase|nr:transposase [Gemmataceae bacterium]